MPYLVRRVKRLIEALNSGQLVLMHEEAAATLKDVQAVQYDEGGEPLLSSVSPKLRSLARSYSLVHSWSESEQRAETKPQIEDASQKTSNSRTIELMRTLFACFEDVFCSLTGSRPDLFTKEQDFATAIRALGASLKGDPKLSQRRQADFARAQERLGNFYVQTKSYLFTSAKELVGMKFVLGGKQSFLDDSLNAVRSMSLYGDTIAIPDPIYRYAEMVALNRPIHYPSMIEDLLQILRLKPLVDADLPFPAIVVFPSWEKSLEHGDETTQDGQERMLLRFFGHYFKGAFDDPSEIFDYVDNNSDRAITAINSNHLLVGYGAEGSEGFSYQIETIRRSHKVYRPEHDYSKVPDTVLAVMTISERLGALYHLNENAQEFGASPLMSLPVHWHYYRLLAQAEGSLLAQSGEIPANLITMGTALTSTEHKWLGNVPVDVLAQLRQRGENEEFRRKLSSQLSELSAADSANVERVSKLVGRALEMMLAEHARDVKRVCDKYELMYAPVAVAAWVTLAAWFLPFLPALPSSAPVTAYAGAKLAETIERYRMGRTLTGALAASAKQRS